MPMTKMVRNSHLLLLHCLIYSAVDVRDGLIGEWWIRKIWEDVVVA